MIIRQEQNDNKARSESGNVKKNNLIQQMKKQQKKTDEEKNRKRNFVDFVCVCEKFFVPLHVFRACMRTMTI